MSARRYRHTQVGWVLIGSVAVPLLLIAAVVIASGLRWFALFFVGLAVLLLGVFSTLSISVDDAALHLRFGVGLVRKSIALAGIRHFSRTRTRWYHGWGIHFAPGGMIYNVSGFDAVELVLDSGKRVRLGTDDPEALVSALSAVLGEPRPLSLSEESRGKSQARRNLVGIASFLAVLLAVIGSLGYLEEQSPVVRLEGGHLTVASFFYSADISLHEITQVSLEGRLPRIRLRTNGYGAGRTLRGNFRLDELGDGKLFIEAGQPPYVLVRTPSSYLIFNLDSEAQTRAAFEELQAARRER